LPNVYNCEPKLSFISAVPVSLQLCAGPAYPAKLLIAPHACVVPVVK
jgi:hypothetical protein